jgi:phage-related protein
MSGINSIVSAFKKIGSVIASVWSGVKKTFSGMVKGMTDIGSNIGKGLWGGLSKMKDWVIDKVKGMGKAILGGLKKVLGINSPSKQFAIVGKYSAEGYVEGLDGMQKEIDKSVSATFNPFTNGSIGSMTTPTPTANVTIHNSMEMDSLGQLVNSVKTFSGGAKNDYNYVGGY